MILDELVCDRTVLKDMKSANPRQDEATFSPPIASSRFEAGVSEMLKGLSFVTVQRL